MLIWRLPVEPCWQLRAFLCVSYLFPLPLFLLLNDLRFVDEGISRDKTPRMRQTLLCLYKEKNNKAEEESEQEDKKVLFFFPSLLELSFKFMWAETINRFS